MDKEKNTPEDPKDEETVVMPDEGVTVADDLEEEMNETGEDVAQRKIEELEASLEKEKKEYLFLMAEFDNFRKRTIKEKSELIKNAAEAVLKGLLPIVDDFERGLNATENVEDPAAVREGMELIYQKLVKYLEKNGVKAIDPEDREFDTNRHEAISAVPVQDEAQKGKILDTVEKGYMLNDKVLRHAKVVVGQ
ncbi:MAG: nucleotide exchange factor GrpE [Porphyromonadaceae bacterium]|jgi:molecular chaperone GrpE|nr:nucleotide exchange factor GrpE [Porphyromonadaceae bacterium]MDD6315096.1 nucleotide exchange factor GrpE [Porphyromonadaceae bacterium]